MADERLKCYGEKSIRWAVNDEKKLDEKSIRCLLRQHDVENNKSHDVECRPTMRKSLKNLRYTKQICHGT